MKEIYFMFLVVCVIVVIGLKMEISISIEPYLVFSKEKLTQYIEKIISVSRELAKQDDKVSLHFDYFKHNPEVFSLVQGYTNQIAIDLHLMQEPVPSVQGFRSVAFDVVDIKANVNQELASNIKAVDESQFGVVLDLGCEIEPYQNLIRQAKYVIIMTVKCGKSGQVFQESALHLVEKVRQLNAGITIIIDGGVNENNAILLKKAGVDVAVVGNYAKKCYENEDLLFGINRLLRV